MRSGLVLSGGGANGAYEVGILKALLRGASPATSHQPLRPESIAATSIGSFNAAVLISSLEHGWDHAIDVLETAWADRMAAPGSISPNGVFRYRPNFIEWLDFAKVVRSPWQPARELVGDATFFARDWMTRAAGFVSGSGGLAHRVAELFDLSTFITPEPSEELVRETVVPARVRQAPVALRVTATNWEKGTLRVFANQDFSDDIGPAVVRASGAIPGIFPPVDVEGVPFVDGGVVLNTPLKPAIDAGADILHVIYLDPALGSVPLRPVGSTIDAIGRMFIATFAATMKRDLEVAASINDDIAAGRTSSFRPITIHLYHPHHDTGGALGMLDFHRDRIVDLAAHGYNDAVNHDCRLAGCLNVTSRTFKSRM